MNRFKPVWVKFKGSKPVRWRRGWQKVSARIYNRIEWGAKDADNAPTIDDWEKVILCVHHTAGPTPKLPTLNAAFKAVRDTQRMHMDANGWNDIGYNYLICNGVIIQGRGYSVRGAGAAIVGQNWNKGYCHVAFVGRYDQGKVLSKADVAAYKMLRAHLTVLGSTITKTVAHGDLMPTACPGDGVRKPLGLRR